MTKAASHLDLAARVLDLVRAVAGPAAEAEVLVSANSLALTRFANSYIHQNVAGTTTTVRLRLHIQGRTATGSTTLTVGDALHDLVVRALAAARLAPPDPGWPGLAAPAVTAGVGTVDEAVLAASPADRAARVRAFVDAAAGLPTAGYCRTGQLTAAFANSAGHSVTGATTEVAMEGIARTSSGDGNARLAGPRLADVDGSVLGARAAAKALAGRDPVELPPGRYEVVLEPTAVQDVLACLAMYGFNGKAVNERRSFARIGEAQFDPAVTIVDDPVGPGAVGLPFDSEGTPKVRLELVSGGVTAALAHDRRSAAAAGTASTGHAHPDSTSWGPLPANLALLPATAGGAGGAGQPGAAEDAGAAGGADVPVAEVPGPAADSAVAALVAGVGRGILVTDHWYTRVLDPRTLVMTGLTRNGVWLVEDGEITRPVRNFRFTQSYPQALGPGAVLGVGSHPVRLPSSWGVASFVAPALHLASWNFTGGASG